MSDCFEKMVQALGIYDLPQHTLYASSPEVEQWAFHAMQAVLWRLSGGDDAIYISTWSSPDRFSEKGCESLAQIEENIVLTFTESGGSDDNRFTMIRNKAEAVCCLILRLGSYILDPEFSASSQDREKKMRLLAYSLTQRRGEVSIRA